MSQEVKRIVTGLVGSLDGFATVQGPKLIVEPKMRKKEEI
jgi:hypothetical protein